MKKKLILIILLLIATNGFTQTVYRIRMRGSSYSAQLRGVAGSPTAGITINGTYSSRYLSHEFLVTVTGDYKLYYDPIGGSSYVYDSYWDDGQNGKTIYADDLVTHMHGHGSGSNNTIASADIASNAVTSNKIANGTILVADVADSQITLAKMTTAVVNYIGSGGSVTNNPDDVTLENKSGITIGLHDDYIDTVRKGYQDGLRSVKVSDFRSEEHTSELQSLS